jgi:hypothetical protein
MADDLNRKLAARLEDIEKRLQRQERANPLEAASVTNGQIRIIGGTIRVDGGGNLIVNGTMSVNGTSTVTGSFTVSGPWNLSGAGTISGNVTITGNVTTTGTLTQNGPWNMNGAGNIAGNVTQTGNTTMTGNFTVTGGGKITVGSMTIDPNISGGAIAFANGAQVFTDGSTIQVYKGNGVLQVSDSEAKIQVGGSAVRVTSGHVYASGMDTKSVATVPGGFVGAVVYESGELKRLT